MAATKRRVRFRFGFANVDALENGMAGIEARGEEHEVSLIWSLTSGKRVVALDGKEVHFSMGRRGDTRFETSWPMQGGHILKLVAHAAPPLRPIPGFKQFELFLDGMSYFCMPRIFELGARRGYARAVEPLAHESAFAYNNYHREENRRRQVNHHDEVRRMTSHSALQSVSQDFTGRIRRVAPEIMPVNSNLVVSTPMPVQDVLSEPAPVGDMLAPAPPTTVAVDEFTPVVAHPTPPTFQDVSNHILSAYDPVAAAPAPINSQVQPLMIQQHSAYANTAYPTQQLQTYSPQPAMVSPGTASGRYYALQVPSTPPQSVVDPACSRAPVVTPTMTMMTPLDVDELRDSPPPVNAMDRAVQNLVNLNDLKETRATPEQLKAKKQKETSKAHQHTSRPKAPAATDWHVGTNASLADIQKHKKPVAPAAKEVMRVHAFDPAAAQAGMMVVYGQQQPTGGYGGSIPTSSGFGAGRVYHQGYSQPFRSAY